MKVALLGPFPPPLGGVSTNVMQLSQLLLDDGYQVKAFVEAREQADGSPAAYWYPSKSLNPHRNLLLRVKEFGPDILHSHASTVRKYDALIARLLSIPLISQIYGERFPEQFYSWSFFPRRFTRWAFRQARMIIPASQELAQFIASFGIAPSRITFIPCLLPLESDDIKSVALPGRINSVLRDINEKILLVTSGFYESHYGLSLVPRIASYLKSQDINFSWVIVGPGSEEEMNSIQQVIDDAGVSDRVVLSGEIDRAQMIALLNSAYIYVRTKSSDSFGIVIAEAHQLGCYCLFGDNNPYFQADGDRLFSYKTGSRESLTTKLMEIIARFDPRTPRDRSSRFRAEARANYQHIKQLYQAAVAQS